MFLLHNYWKEYVKILYLAKSFFILVAKL